MRTRRGFTLIELLVVIAIIAILAAILFPVFAKAREKARAISCLSNAKQLGLAAMMYVQDYDEHYPMLYGYYITPGYPCTWNVTSWRALMVPYIKNDHIFECPSSSAQGTVNRWMYDPAVGGYGANDRILRRNVLYVGIPGGPLKIAAVGAPANIIMLGESPTRDYISYRSGQQPESYMLFQHNGLMTTTFADGHAKATNRDFCWIAANWEP